MKVMLPDVIPNTLPQQLDDRLCAIGFENAGSPELEKAQLRMCRDYRTKVKLALRLESAVCRCNLLPQQTIGADEFTFFQ